MFLSKNKTRVTVEDKLGIIVQPLILGEIVIPWNWSRGALVFVRGGKLFWYGFSWKFDV